MLRPTALASSEPRFVIVPHRARNARSTLLLVALWLLSLLACFWLTRILSVPNLARTAAALDASQQRVRGLETDLEGERQNSALLARSDQVSQTAIQELQSDLSARDEEIASLRADITFYERLVGGSAVRRGLSVHSVHVETGANGDLSYQVTLTQNVKKAGLTRGSLSLSIEGVAGGALQTLDWAGLKQQPDAGPQAFEFRYFQQLDGSVMLPAGFVPQRLRVLLLQDGSRNEQAFEWKDVSAPKEKS